MSSLFINTSIEEVNSIEESLNSNPVQRAIFESARQRKRWVKEVAPSYENKHIGGTIDNWSYSPVSKSVIGSICDDDRFPDGYEIRTSYVVKLDEENRTLETRNTIYHLGNRAY